MKSNISIIMKIRFGKSILLLVAAMSSIPSYSQMRHEFELMAGTSVVIGKVEGESKNVTFPYGGPSFSTRYSLFANNHLGAFAQFEVETDFCGERKWFGALNKADGGKYLYRFKEDGSVSESRVDFFAGGAFRMAVSQWNITTRLGAGAIIFSNGYSFERRSRDGSTGPEYFDIEMVGRQKNTEDYLISDSSKDDSTVPTVFALKAELQFARPHNNRIGYMFGAVGLNMPVSKVTEKTSALSSAREHNPTNWVEAVAWDGSRDNWIADKDATVITTRRITMQPSITIRLGYCFMTRINR